MSGRPRLAPPMRGDLAAGPAALMLAIVLCTVPLPSFAVAPFVMLMAKQIVRDAVRSTLKQGLLSALSASGCKGQAIASTLITLDTARNGGLPALGAMVGGMAGAATMPPLSSMPSMPLGGTPPRRHRRSASASRC